MADARISAAVRSVVQGRSIWPDPTPYRPFYDKIELPISTSQKQAQELFP
jgi:hypothetical protein